MAPRRTALSALLIGIIGFLCACPLWDGNQNRRNATRVTSRGGSPRTPGTLQDAGSTEEVMLVDAGAGEIATCLEASSLACGPSAEEDACGLSGTPPSEEEVVDGFVAATTMDGTFAQPGSWSSGSNGDITAGTLSMIIANDQSGSVVSELVGRGVFPICVPLGERSPTSGTAVFDYRFVTDASHTGMVAILGEDADFLFGRFYVQLKDISGNSEDTVLFTDGVFRIPGR